MLLSEITADNVAGWLARLERLAAAVASVGPSDDGAEATGTEEWARTSRDRFLNEILLAIAAFALLVFAALYVFGWLFVGT